MKTEGLVKAQKEVRIMVGLSYILTGMFVPLMIIHFLYFLLLIPNLLLIYYCRQLSEDMEEFVDRVYRWMLYIAEDALEDIRRHVYAINLICAIMSFTVLALLAANIHEQPIFVLTVIPLALYVTIILMSNTFTTESALKELFDLGKEEEKKEEYKKEDLEIKLPRERPLKKK